MYKLNSILENQTINKLIESFERSPKQLNKPHKSDAEIIRLNDNTKLAITTDSISEEISTGLYDDPYMIGWMIVTVTKLFLKTLVMKKLQNFKKVFLMLAEFIIPLF